jgi:hypothetical protein
MEMTEKVAADSNDNDGGSGNGKDGSSSNDKKGSGRWHIGGDAGFVSSVSEIRITWNITMVAMTETLVVVMTMAEKAAADSNDKEGGGRW